MSKQVIIVGGGVIGLCCAYYLQKQEYNVTVIERGDITKGTSFGNAGYVSPSHFIPLASPGIVAKGLRWMLSSTSPFYIKPRLNADLIRWGLTFWKNANEKKVRQNIPPLNNILHLSRELMSDIKNDIGNHFRMEEIGCLMLYKTPATEKHEMELAEEAAHLGIETTIFNAQQVQDMEAEVEVNVRGGVLYPVDCHLHPVDFMQTLKNHLQSTGVKLQLDTEVRGFEKNGVKVKSVITNDGKFDCDELVVATGSWLPVITEQRYSYFAAGRKRLQHHLSKYGKNLHYPAILVDNRVAMTPMGRDLRMGGTMEISGINNNILIKRVQAIFNASRIYYPNLRLSFRQQKKYGAVFVR